MMWKGVRHVCSSSLTCRRVKIWIKDNTELINPEGPFVLWDFCIDPSDGDCAMKPDPEIGLAGEHRCFTKQVVS